MASSRLNPAAEDQGHTTISTYQTHRRFSHLPLDAGCFLKIPTASSTSLGWTSINVVLTKRFWYEVRRTNGILRRLHRLPSKSIPRIAPAPPFLCAPRSRRDVEFSSFPRNCVVCYRNLSILYTLRVSASYVAFRNDDRKIEMIWSTTPAFPSVSSCQLLQIFNVSTESTYAISRTKPTVFAYRFPRQPSA